jgi:Domain of unknown function (DUF3854)/Family of unknown function (DUF5906)
MQKRKSIPPPLIAEFRRRGLKPNQAQELPQLMRLEYFTAEQANKLFPEDKEPKNRAGFKIPYHNLDGTPMSWIDTKTGERHEGFFRFRYLGPPQGFDALVKDHPYRQPKNSPPMPYFPPFVDWSEILNNAALELVGVEGEIKAAILAMNGIATFGVGGVWNFRSKKAGVLLLPQIAELAKGRKTTVCYDSDVATNPKVLAARSALAEELIYAEADAWVAPPLPALEGFDKTGPDDFVLVKGVDTFREHLAKAEHAAKDILEFNREVVYVRAPYGFVVRLEDLVVVDMKKFYDDYKGRTITLRNSKGEAVRKRLTEAWMESPLRRTVQGITYFPEGPLITEDGKINIWPGWACEPKPGNVEPFKKMFNRQLHNATKKQKKWAWQRIAFAVQNPAIRIPTAIVFTADPGCGKSMIGWGMRAIYGRNYKQINEVELNDKFNDWQEYAGFVMAEELTSGDKRGHHEQLKLTISEPYVTIRKKFLAPYELPNFSNLYMVSNHRDSVYVPDDKERRLFVADSTLPKLSKAEREEYAEWLKTGGPALLYYLKHFPTKDFDAWDDAPLTVAKEEMIIASRSGIETGVAELKVNPAKTLGKQATLWTEAEMLKIYDPFDKHKVAKGSLSKKLGKVGFKQWGKKGKRAMEVKALGTRVWIISSDAAEVAKLNNLNEQQLYALYAKQHEKFAQEGGSQQKEKDNA